MIDGRSKWSELGSPKYQSDADMSDFDKPQSRADKSMMKKRKRDQGEIEDRVVDLEDKIEKMENETKTALDEFTKPGGPASFKQEMITFNNYKALMQFNSVVR